MALTDTNPTLDMVEPYVPPDPAAQNTPQTVNSNYVAPEQYKPAETDTVQGRMTGLLASGSPYMENAKQEGIRYAQGRGLLNSNLAGESGQKAAISAALPIAQQDSASFVNAGMEGYKGKIEAGLTDAKANASSQLSAQEANQNLNLDQQQQANANFRQQVELDVNKQIEQMGLTSDEIKAIGSSVTLLGQTLSEQMTAIQTDSNLSSSAKTTIIKQLTASYKANVNSVASIYGVPIEWA